MKKRRVLYKTGEQIAGGVGVNSWFNLKFAEKIAIQFAQKLFGRSDWESGLEALSNLWLRSQSPTLAYATVVEVDYSRYASRYVAVNKWENGEGNL